MTNVIMPVTPEVQRATDLLDEVILRFAENGISSLPTLGRYESDIEALNMMKLIIRHVEAVVILGRDDLVLLPAALTLTRTSYETAIRLLWMLDPEDPFDREARWLTHLWTDEHYHDTMAKLYRKLGIDDTKCLSVRDTIKSFREAVDTKLPERSRLPAQPPSLRHMAISLDEERKYIAYKALSQTTHATHAATSTYCKHLGDKKELGEFIEPSDWYAPLLGCWYSMHAPGYRLLERLGGDPTAFLTNDFAMQVQESIDCMKGKE